jgi:hypothetical protein
MERLKQWCLWLARKCCEAIIVIVDACQAVVEMVKEVATVAVEVAVEVGKRISANEFVQDIRDGVKAVKKLTDGPETLHSIWLIGLWLWSMAMGLACSSYVEAPWAAASTAFCAIGVIYFAMFTTTIIFALFLIGRLARPDRS